MDLLRAKLKAAGFHRILGGDAPDQSGQNEAALQSVALSKEQLAWAKDVYAQEAPARDAAAARANASSDLQFGAAKSALALADEQQARYKGTFQPLEDKQVQDALSYNTPARQEQAAAKAGNEVKLQFAAGNAAGVRAQQRAGVNPSDGASQSAALNSGYAQALGVAGAENGARTQVEQLGAAKLADAVALGRGVIGTQATQTQLGTSAAGAATASGLGSLQPAATGAAMLSSGYQGAQAGINSAANIYGNIANTQAQANAQGGAALAGIGSAIGTVAVAY